MTNNNGIPIEVNKKPFETVQELKNETPSFEEFMKDYKTDENLNYDDLNGGDVGPREGYGPCGVCKKAEQYVDLKVACFSCSNPHVSTWYHDKDGCRSSNTQISNKAYIKCKSCGTDRHMSNWNFECSWHRGKPQSINRKAYNKAMSIALGMDDCSQVVTDLSTYIVYHPEKFDNN